jgi:hypothetical protein
MSCVSLDMNARYLRHRALGTEALYEVVSESDGIVTASVVSAPGLEAGTRVKLLARTAEAMERLDAAPAEKPQGRFSRSARGFAGQLVAR